jgi:hypothetical protein
MDSIRRRNTQAALMSLEVAAASARGGFACVLSSSDEYETALISEWRAQGRYGRPGGHWPMLMLVGCSMMVVGMLLLG